MGTAGGATPFIYDMKYSLKDIPAFSFLQRTTDNRQQTSLIRLPS
jgi:hypothetical protein